LQTISLNSIHGPTKEIEEYSLLDGQASVARLVDKAMQNGMKGIAVTDHGNMLQAAISASLSAHSIVPASIPAIRFFRSLTSPFGPLFFYAFKLTTYHYAGFRSFTCPYSIFSVGWSG